jgi:coenzyme F420-reducing hydrogenase beta subunit
MMGMKRQPQESPYRNVCEVIVPAGVCIGCGLCAGICPVDVLEMRFNDYGEYNPVELRPGCVICSLCFKVCPFWNQEDNEDSLARSTYGGIPGIQHRSETGYYMESFVGHVRDEEIRRSRSAGGLAVWLQEQFLKKGLADAVLGVVQSLDKERRFQFAVIDEVKAIRHSARSAYYPVETSGVIAHVLQQRGRYVVVGLPCFIKAARLGMRRNIKLRKRIVCTIGLVCGGGKGRQFTEYLIAAAGGDAARTTRLDFRYKDPRRVAGDYALRFEHMSEQDGQARRVICDPDIRRQVWRRDYFLPGACNYCDDLFAELADVACMDAWLPPYNRDWRGTNLLIVRAPQVLSLIQDGKGKHDLAVETVGIQDVIRSQAKGLANKRELLAHRLYLAEKQEHGYLPRKRVRPKRLHLLSERALVSIRERMRVASRRRFASAANGSKPLRLVWFRTRMLPLVFTFKLVGRMQRLASRALRSPRR